MTKLEYSSKVCLMSVNQKEQEHSVRDGLNEPTTGLTEMRNLESSGVEFFDNNKLIWAVGRKGESQYQAKRELG